MTPHPTQQLLAAGTNTGVLLVCATADGRPLHARCLEGEVVAVALSRAGQVLAALHHSHLAGTQLTTWTASSPTRWMVAADRFDSEPSTWPLCTAQPPGLCATQATTCWAGATAICVLGGDLVADASDAHVLPAPHPTIVVVGTTHGRLGWASAAQQHMDVVAVLSPAEPVHALASVGLFAAAASVFPKAVVVLTLQV
jgi:hypothetical protein